MSGQVTFWAITLGVPTSAFVANVMVRHKIRLPQSYGVDWLLLLVVMDVTAVLSADDFARALSHAAFRNEPMGPFGILAALSALTWLYTILYIEPKIHKPRPRAKSGLDFGLLTKVQNSLASSKSFWISLSWFFAAFASAANLYVFTLDA